MSDPQDPLIGKADSLISRLGSDPLGKLATPVDSPAALESDIPVLEEILTPAVAKSPQGPLIDEHTKQLIIKTALAQLVPLVDERITRDLQQRLLNHLSSAANAAVTVAIADLKLELANAVGDAVNRAIHDVLRK